MKSDSFRVLFYAPNVHVGGGFVLLKAALEEQKSSTNIVLWLDIRARPHLEVNSEWKIHWVYPSLKSRFYSEIELYKLSTADDLVLCFHGLPPVLPCRASVNVFQQNRNYLGGFSLKSFAFRTRLRLVFEQTISKLFKKNVNTYWVQTPSMASSIKKWYGNESVHVETLPFALQIDSRKRCSQPLWDFIYVADGEAHKNHINLIEAWISLAKLNIRPSLVLTLSERDKNLKDWISFKVSEHNLKVHDIGQKPHNEILDLYCNSRALIFPSKSESFGLPLIEASKFGLPIIAGELDFIRDVCTPVETFDPESSTSITRAVRRFLGFAELPLEPSSARTFWNALVDKNFV